MYGCCRRTVQLNRCAGSMVRHPCNNHQELNSTPVTWPWSNKFCFGSRHINYSLTTFVHCIKHGFLTSLHYKVIAPGKTFLLLVTLTLAQFCNTFLSYADFLPSISFHCVSPSQNVGPKIKHNVRTKYRQKDIIPIHTLKLLNTPTPL